MRSNRIIPIRIYILYYMKQLHLILCILILISGLLVVLSSSPVESVLFLILTFCTAGTMLFFFNLEFFGLIFIIIYVGAIAVLFLFVVMMLNIKLHSSLFGILSLKNVILSLVLLLLTYIIFVNISLCFYTSVPAICYASNIVYSKASYIFDALNNIEVFGQVFYNYFLVYLPLAGFILLISLIGAVVLTLHFNKPKKFILDSRQLSRTDNFITFFSYKQ